ncbi:MAG: hypothetical protein COU35_00845 [Candidatus Magasanikbacteria bacterium CG10_big_fil_rev_8_21_14_0_10_47_10]|uniref:Divalent metal cation transporter n=1 Tax=Candidatus Magasanikbacteria bacterium CG10_big_fil_rev_8_21_14_0_10_47_10 TaxID=1974652 RepID=A0A2H0TRD6_9BACT|nr:MAG: hypothetical protein COU35_00845 [Candidatus Magasanikbacteria bacterium CG10_big_fil_rev_8_21_14_0_10_47_10]
MAHKPFPKPLSIRRLLGPSYILLALGLGSGEVILWPYLTSNYGLGIAWGALLGITFQFFLNMEIERYALLKGESVFIGLANRWKWAPYWFAISTFIGFGIPGIIAASAEVFAHLIGADDFKWTAIFFLLAIGLVLSLGQTVYGILEKTTKTIIYVAVPFIFILAIIIATKMDWIELFQGLGGVGKGYRWLPEGISFAAFFAAFAYSGAGGNLNLTQSIYIKEKGYGMGKYAQKIEGLFRGSIGKQKIKLTGETFAMTESNLKNFRSWWRRINLEHLMIFWFFGGLAMLLLMLLSYATTYGLPSNVEGIKFVINEGLIVGQQFGSAIGTLFLLAVSIMLFQTQLGVMDSTSRIMAENVAIKKTQFDGEQRVPLSRIYYIFLWAQIFLGITLFLFNIKEPRTLIILGAVINAFTMFVHVGMVNWMNHKTLPKQVQAALWRKIIILIVFLFFGAFSAYTIYQYLFCGLLPMIPCVV